MSATPMTGDAQSMHRLAGAPRAFGPAVAARPSLPGPGMAPGNVEVTGVQEDPGVVGGGTLDRPERYLLVVRLVADGADGTEAERRFLFARWPGWPHPAMLSLSPPGSAEGLAAAVERLLRARTGVRTAGEPALAPRHIPVRMRHPRTGVEGLGWLRPVAVAARGDPSPDALLEAVEVLAHDEALRALSTEVERLAFRAGAALLAGPEPLDT